MDARSERVRSESLTFSLGPGIVVFVRGTVGIVADIAPGLPASGPGLHRGLDR